MLGKGMVSKEIIKNFKAFHQGCRFFVVSPRIVLRHTKYKLTITVRVTSLMTAHRHKTSLWCKIISTSYKHSHANRTDMFGKNLKFRQHFDIFKDYILYQSQHIYARKSYIYTLDHVSLYIYMT